MERSREYWEKRISDQGLDAVSTVGDVKPRTEEEVNFLTMEITKIYPYVVELAIDFGSGWGRLFPVLEQTSRIQILVDFVEENKRLFEMVFPNRKDAFFEVRSIKDFPGISLADYALTSFSLLHIIDNDEFRDSVEAIKKSVKEGGYLFIYESYNESGKVAPHCSNRNREQFLAPFSDCELVKEIPWESVYQPYEVNFRQPIKMFVFRKN